MLTKESKFNPDLFYSSVNNSTEEIEIIIKAIYKQVLGNAHVMESERLTALESQLKHGNLSVREFVRQLAKSELYRNLFFHNCPRYRSIELNFKHLLGRAPYDYSETFHHSQILDQEGFFAEIDSYIDSDEYQSVFGEDIFPYTRGYDTQTGQKLLGFTNMSKLLTSNSTSDKASETRNSSRIQRFLMYNNPIGAPVPTDIQAILDEVFRPKPKTIPAQVTNIPVQKTNVPAYPWQQINNQEEEKELIQSLEKRLRELQTVASVGAGLLGKWLTNQTSTAGFTSTLNNRNQTNEEIIASLKSQIADLERLAAFGERKLNQWRKKMF